MGERVVKGQRLVLSLVAWGRLGEAMAESQGEDLFVFGGIPGERVVAEVIRVHRRYATARVIEVLEPSPWRVQPPCSYYGDCTGCQWQHLDYQRQLEVKRDKVADALQRVGGFRNTPVSGVVPSPGRFGYRNHARFTVGREGDLGFVHRETKQFVRIDHCMLMHDGVNDALAALQGKCRETTQLSVRAGQHTQDTLVQPSLAHPEIPVPTGQKAYLDSINGRRFRVSSPSFFQVNVDQAAQVVRVIQQALKLRKTDVLLDAYMGVGAFAVLLAPYVKKVIAVEESSAAVADARENIGGTDNIELVLGKTESVLRQLGEKPDVVVLDPPRAGCHPEALAGLLEMQPPKIAYVSCDPETLARDLKVLCSNAGPGGETYSLQRVVPLDMFPQTHHVECVALLVKTGIARSPRENGGNSSSLVLASESPRRKELLEGLGLDFQVIPSNIREEQLPGEAPPDMVQRLSREKAVAVAKGRSEGYVIGADSVVELDGEALGKPSDADEARRMLRRLRGTRHRVITGVTVVDASSGRILTDSMASGVVLRSFSDAEMEASIASGAPLDKAGAYAVQDQDFRPAQSWHGCYTNIVGLPLCRLGEMLEEMGYQFPGGEGWPVLVETGTTDCGPACPSRGVSA